MNCKDCEQARVEPHWGGYHASCRGCQIRAIAEGPAFWAAVGANAITGQYRAALQAFFGSEWLKAHEEVKAEYQRIKELKKQKERV